jgi:hypothetical protein
VRWKSYNFEAHRQRDVPKSREARIAAMPSGENVGMTAEIMKMRWLTSPFILTMLLLGMPTWANAQTTNPLFGTWRVTSFKLHVIGEPEERDLFGPNPKGYIILTPEPRIMAFVVADGRQPPANQAEAAAMLQSMIA